MAPSIEFEIFAVKRWEDHQVKMHMASLQGTVKQRNIAAHGNGDHYFAQATFNHQ